MVGLAACQVRHLEDVEKNEESDKSYYLLFGGTFAFKIKFLKIPFSGSIPSYKRPVNFPEDAINEGLGNLQQRGIHTSQAGLDPERVERMRHFRDVKGAYFIVKKTITDNLLVCFG